MCFFYQNPNIAGLRHLKHIHLKRKLLLLLLKKKGNSSKLLTSGYIYICTQAIILLLSGVFLTGVIHFCTQKSCIFKCLWWISCSNFEPFSRIFNAQTSTKTWVGTCAHKQQLLCHSPVDPHRHPWIPTGTHRVLCTSPLLCCVPGPDRGWGFTAGLQSQALPPELQNLPQALSSSQGSKQLSALGAQR